MAGRIAPSEPSCCCTVLDDGGAALASGEPQMPASSDFSDSISLLTPSLARALPVASRARAKRSPYDKLGLSLYTTQTKR